MIAPSTLRGYAEGTPQTPQERQRQERAQRQVQQLEKEYNQATRATQPTQPEKKPLPPLEKIQKIVQDEGEVAVSALAETLEATEEEVLEAALPDLMTGKIHLAPGPTFVDWSKKEDRGKAQPMPEIKKAFVRAYIKKALRQA